MIDLFGMIADTTAATIAEWRDHYGVIPLVLTGGGAIGLIFGVLSERSDYCSRMALVHLMDGTWRKNTSTLLSVMLAMLTALIGVQAVAFSGGVARLDAAISHETDLRVGGIVLGSMLFGMGMVLARGCVSRLLVLTGRGNSRALITVVFLALIAWSSISGILSSPRLALAGLGRVEFSGNHGHGIAIILGFILISGIFYLWPHRGAFKLSDVATSFGIGLLVLAGFLVTGVIGADDFDPVPVEGLRFLQPVAETLSWWTYGTALPLKFGLTVVLGTVLGAGLSALWSGRSKVEGFDDAPHPFQYLIGAGLMGFGGVVSGGCTIGWLLNNASTAHLGVVLAVLGYIAGYKVVHASRGIKGWAKLAV